MNDEVSQIMFKVNLTKNVCLLGIVCIDELEKMDRYQQQVLIQSIEHEKIGIKNNLNGFLFCPSNISMIMAANLKSEKYNYSKSQYQNVKIAPELFGKFDLIFLLNSHSNEDEDTFEKEFKKGNSFTGNSVETDSLIDLSVYETQCIGKIIFKENRFLSLSTIRNYVAYCYHYVHPVIDENTKNYIIKICTNEFTSSFVLSKLRVYETLLRLSEAHAKLFMRAQVTKDDVKMAKTIMKSSFCFAEIKTSNFFVCLLFSYFNNFFI